MLTCGMKLLIYSQTSTVQTLKLGMDKLFDSTFRQACDYLSIPEFKLIHVGKSGLESGCR